jgi:hypothetical protein
MVTLGRSRPQAYYNSVRESVKNFTSKLIDPHSPGLPTCGKNSMDPSDVQSEQRSESKRGWQYSLFGLLVVTTIVSICLALGVSFPRVAIAAVAVGLVQAAALYLADWLIRSRGGRTLKQVTSIMRAVLGTALLIIATAVATAPAPHTSLLALMVAYVIGSIGLLCWILAWRYWP